MTNTATKLHAIGLATILLASVLGSTVALTGSVGAAVQSGSLDVEGAPVQPDGNITVGGEVNTTGNVTFLIQDPDGKDVATVTKSVSNTNFSDVEIDLGGLSFGDGLNDGTATIRADKGDGFQSAEALTTFEVDNEFPAVNITAPADGASETSMPTVEGTASDDAALDAVEVTIQQSDGDYYNGSEWVSSEAWLSVSGTNDWSYDLEGDGITADGTYTVSVRATDEAGHTMSHSSGPPVPGDSSATLQVDYTVDSTSPAIDSVNVTEKNGDDTVTVGDTVNVSVNVTDATSGVSSVMVDASQLGSSSSLTLSHNTGSVYHDSFTVGEPAVSDGSVSLTATATDEFGLSSTDSDTLTLDTAIETVETLTIHQDFLGVVADQNTSVRVTATEVRDPQGKLVASDGASDEQATLKIADTRFTVNVSGGAIDARIDPTAITDDVQTGNVTAKIVEANATSATERVQLVHEALNLKEGYQLRGTPMDASEVVFEGVSDVTTYDPTATNTKWISPNEKQAGGGYYVYGETGQARMGFIFNETGELHSEYLHQGYNLVAPTPDLNVGNTSEASADLGDGVSVSSSNVMVYVRDYSESLTTPDGEATVEAFDQANATTDISAYEGYFVYIDSSEEIRTVEKAGYAPSEGS